MARGCALIDSRLDTAKIGSDGRVEVHRARLLAVFGGTKNVSTRPGSFATKLDRPRHVRFPPVSDRTADIAGGPFRAKGGSDPDSRRRETAIALNRYAVGSS